MVAERKEVSWLCASSDQSSLLPASSFFALLSLAFGQPLAEFLALHADRPLSDFDFFS
jgi:hypothetical protein